MSRLVSRCGAPPEVLQHRQGSHQPALIPVGAELLTQANVRMEGSRA